MAVDTPSNDYMDHIDDWELLDDVHKGERAIKKGGTKYLPMLGGQDAPEYAKYKDRGSFFNAFGRTVQGLVGYIFRKDGEYSVPQKVEDMFPTIMSTGQGYDNLRRKATNAVLKYGRVGLLVDAQGESDPYIAIYEPSAIIKARVTYINGKETLTLLILKEIVSVETDKQFEFDEIEQYRSFELKEDIVEVNVWAKEKKTDKWVITEGPIYPKIMGKYADEICFYFIGSEENSAAINKPPLLDMAYVSINHWRYSVDYNHGLHFCALPTPWAAGFDADQTLTIGPVNVWRSDDPQAQCGFLEFTGQGLSTLRVAMDKAEEQMAILGARIIEQTRSRVETAEAARIRQSGESGALTSIVNNVSAGLTDALQMFCRWVGADGTDVYDKLNTDFIDTQLTPQELTALLKAYQAGGISLDTFLWNLEQGELLPEYTSIEDEKLRIEAEGMDSFDNEDNENDNNENDENDEDSITQ